MTPRRLALLTALALGLALVVVLWLRIPWAATPQVSDPTGGLTTDQLDRADSFAAALRPASVANLLLGLVVSGVLGLTRTGARWVTAVARPLGGGWFWQVVLGTVVLTAAGRVVTLPLAAYGEVVRHRFGLSTRSWPLWARDVAVDTGITAGLTALGLVLLVAVARRAPRTWWAWVGVGAAGLVVAGSFLYPVVIEPAFNDFTSLPAGPLRTDLLDLAAANGTPVQDVLVADASRRTTALNAYVSGFGSTRRIVVYDTLLDQLPDDQIESIAAHELGHVATDDVLTGTLVGALGAGAGVALLGWLLGSAPLLRRAGAEGPGDPRVVPLVLLLVAVGTLLSTPVQNGVSRQLEARADQHSLDLAEDPDAFAAVMRRLAVANLNQPDPPAAWQWFFGSHPTTAQRVAAAQEWSR
ncbi:M48 family metallopeptidase [Klenkia terrae]|uniref:M48 family metallopeptidase n=1 Tax=Klenkia terrae TaxID=1052259 RepID=A0ABU8E4N2_9ACTN|nr:M48 family metallopeptidase [Klenkia terrae]